MTEPVQQMTAEISELLKEIERLKARIAALEARPVRRYGGRRYIPDDWWTDEILGMIRRDHTR